MRALLVTALVCGAAWPAGLPADVTVLNEELEVLHAERMGYPLRARVHAAEGAVVIKVELNDDGTVRSALAISGPKWLIEECAGNARKWTFGRVAQHTAYIVYVFTIRGACTPPCASNSEFYPPNLVMVSVGRQIVMPVGGYQEGGNQRQ